MLFVGLSHADHVFGAEPKIDDWRQDLSDREQIAVYQDPRKRPALTFVKAQAGLSLIVLKATSKR